MLSFLLLKSMKRPIGSVVKAKKLKKKGRKTSKLHSTEMPALYTEDLGVEGTKESRTQSFPTENTFHLPLTHQELERRQDRQVSSKMNKQRFIDTRT